MSARVNTGTAQLTTEPSLAFRQWVDTLQAALTGIQHGGGLQIDVAPYLSDVSIHPTTPQPEVNQALVMGLLLLGGLLLLSILWR